MKNMAKIVVLVAACVSMNMYADAQDDLLNAVSRGDLKGVQAALTAGANVNAIDRRLKKGTVLMYAVEVNINGTSNIDVVNALIKAGANVNAVDNINQGTTVLGYAIQSGNLDAVKALIAAGANQQSIMSSNDWQNVTALGFAQEVLANTQSNVPFWNQRGRPDWAQQAQNLIPKIQAIVSYLQTINP